MNRVILFAVVTLAMTVGWAGPLDSAILHGETDKANPLSYSPGEEIVFTLKLQEAGCLRENDYFIRWVRTGDDGKEDRGFVPLQASKPLIVRTRLGKPGFVRLLAVVETADGRPYQKRYLGETATPEGKRALNAFEQNDRRVFFDGGAGVEVDALQSVPEPPDFDAFWQERKNRLAKVPMESTVREHPSRNCKVRVYSFSVACSGPRPVTGTYTVPVDGTRKYPAHITFHGYGASYIQPIPQDGPENEILMHINAHGYELGREREYYTEFYRSIMSNGKTFGFDSQWQNQSRETAYFGGMCFRIMRALQFLKSLPEWDGVRLVASGGSMGGLQTMWAVGLDPDVSEARPSIPWCCDIGGRDTLGRIVDSWSIRETPALRYFDPVNLAKRVNPRSVVDITRAGLGDYCCPPSGVAVLYNNLPCKKRIKWVQGSTHGYVPAEPHQTVVREAPSALSIGSLVPQPRKIQPLGGVLKVDDAEIDRAVGGFSKAEGIPDEGYRLIVDSRGIRVVAASGAGAFYARQTLIQLRGKEGAVPCVIIDDAPKFSWRGLHLDEARHFFGKAAVLRLLETMALFKLNVLHWHLTDDQGWRVPIPGYPKLVETIRPVENRRNFRDLVTAGTYGPHSYARADLVEIVNRAHDLHIRIVPEVEIPGHSKAVLAAYPELACSVPDRKVENAVCVGKDETIRFYERAIDELCEIFPGAVIHIGGDECNREDWQRCPDCQSRMKREGLMDAAALQAWVTAHFERYLARKGRRLMGWDEIAEGGLPSKAMVMSWRGTSTGIAAARNGHDVVMTPCEYCYFDYDQCIADDCQSYPCNWTVLLPTAKVYGFDPLKGIPEEGHPHVLGGQGNNWSEMTCTASELEWKIWPRAAALSEVLWTYPKKRDFSEFAARMSVRRQELVRAGVNVAPVMGGRAADAAYGSIVRSQTEGGESIRYVCGGKESKLTLERRKILFRFPDGSEKSFVRNDFEDIELLEAGGGSHFATAHRKGGTSCVTFLFDGDRILVKDRAEELPEAGRQKECECQ